MFTWYRRDFHSGARRKVARCLHKAVFIRGAILIVPENWWNFNEYGRSWNEQSCRVYMTPEWIFVPGWKSRSCTRTGVNSRRYDSRRHDILWRCHVNEYGAIRGNRGELAPGLKVAPVSCKHHLTSSFFLIHFPAYLSILCFTVMLVRSCWSGVSP